LPHLCNPLDNGIDIAHYFEVPEAQHSIPLGLQELAPALVLLFLFGVLRTSTSMINLASRQTKSTKNGPIEYCLRNWNP